MRTIQFNILRNIFKILIEHDNQSAVLVYQVSQSKGQTLVDHVDVVYVEFAGLLVQLLKVVCHISSWYCHIATFVWVVAQLLDT